MWTQSQLCRILGVIYYSANEGANLKDQEREEENMVQCVAFFHQSLASPLKAACGMGARLKAKGPRVKGVDVG